MNKIVGNRKGDRSPIRPRTVPRNVTTRKEKHDLRVGACCLQLITVRTGSNRLKV